MQDVDAHLLVRRQFESLSRKYDALLSSKLQAERRYKDDYKKWRSFKKWLMTKSKHAGSLRAQLEKDLSLQLELEDLLQADGMDFMDDDSARSIKEGILNQLNFTFERLIEVFSVQR